MQNNKLLMFDKNIKKKKYFMKTTKIAKINIRKNCDTNKGSFIKCFLIFKFK